MNNDEKILKALEALRADVKDLNLGQERIEKGQAEILATQQEHTKQLSNLNHEIGHVQTSLKLVATRGDVEAAIEAGIAELKVDLIKKIQSHERRITNLEEKTDTPNPDKN